MRSVTLILVLISQLCFGQSKEKGEIIISGSFDSQYLRSFKESPEIWYYDQYDAGLENIAKKIPLNIINGKFSTRISPKNKIGYFLFKAEFDRGPAYLFSLFIIEKGDNINIHIQNGQQISFNGKGSEKLNFLNYFAKLNSSSLNRYKIGDSKRIDYCRDELKTKLISAFDSLDKFKSKISDTVYNLIRINVASEIYSNYILNIASGSYSADSTYLKNLCFELSNLNLQQIAFTLNNRFIINNSSSYIFYLYRLNLTRLAVAKGDNRKRPPIESVFSDITTGYSGLVRDKLLINFVQDYMRNPDITKYAINALSIIEEPRLKTLLSQILSSKSQGAKAFDFVLTNTEGKLVRLNDFRGKVIVIDTWFNGCTGCIHLADRLKPIEAYYKDKNVVFLSVNVDKDKKRFIEGVKSNLYGAKESIYLYTNGMGQNHPMILHYKYRGYPNLLIIDKMGQIISSNPPFPTNKEKIDEFKNLINSNL